MSTFLLLINYCIVPIKLPINYKVLAISKVSSYLRYDVTFPESSSQVYVA